MGTGLTNAVRIHMSLLSNPNPTHFAIMRKATVTVAIMMETDDVMRMPTWFPFSIGTLIV
jgi:hypothetical protein